MDNRKLKLHEPRICAAFDRWMETAGFPDWKIGGEQFERFFDGKEWPETETKIDMLGWVVDDVLRMVDANYRRTVANEGRTPEAVARRRRLVRSGKRLWLKIFEENRKGKCWPDDALEAGTLKARAPDLCAIFDRFCKAAGRPGMKVGGEEWNAVARREASRMAAIPDALLIPLEEISKTLTVGRETTPAERKRIQRLAARANAFASRVRACDRIGIFH